MTPSPDALRHRAAALVDRRAELMASRPRGDAELAALTESLFRTLRSPARVRRLRLGPGSADGRADERADEELARRLAAAEPVNPVAGEEDLLDRFDDDRRVFVLEHDELPHRPVSVVWVALRRGLPERLGELLDPSAPTLDPREADTAVFYSIWNAEPGLAGLGGGRELLEGVLERLGGELPGLRAQATMSPVPGFRAWLRDRGMDDTSPPEDTAVLCARYLTSMDPAGRVLDPVARFHLGNGASLHRIRPGADPSTLGLQRSWGAMAHYRYAPEDLHDNRAALAEGRPVLGEAIRALLGSP